MSDRVRGEEIELEEGDEEILDRIWDRIHQEELAKEATNKVAQGDTEDGTAENQSEA